MDYVSVSSHYVWAVLRYAPDSGLEVDQLLRRAGIPVRLLSEPEARVSAEQFARLQAITMRGMNDEMLGYCAAPVPLGAWSAMCHWVIHARTLGQAFKRFRHFYGMMGLGPEVQLLTKGERLHIQFLPRGSRAMDAYAYELFMFSFFRLACWLTESGLPVEEARFAFAAPSHAKEFRALFPGAAIEYSQPLYELVAKRKVMEMAIQQSAQSLPDFLSKPTFSILQNDYDVQSWVARTREALRGQLPDLPNLTELAAQLEIHPKKLRRNLEKEGFAYGELKNQLRRDVAIQLLTKYKDPVEQIAFKVGYSESCTFVRAFRQWTGVTPRTYRKQKL